STSPPSTSRKGTARIRTTPSPGRGKKARAASSTPLWAIARKSGRIPATSSTSSAASAGRCGCRERDRHVVESNSNMRVLPHAAPPSPRLLAIALLALLAAASGLALQPVQGATQPSAPRPAVDGNRGPWRLAFSPDGRHVYVSEAEEGTVAV